MHAQTPALEKGELVDGVTVPGQYEEPCSTWSILVGSGPETRKLASRVVSRVNRDGLDKHPLKIVHMPVEQSNHLLL